MDECKRGKYPTFFGDFGCGDNQIGNRDCELGRCLEAETIHSIRRELIVFLCVVDDKISFQLRTSVCEAIPHAPP